MSNAFSGKKKGLCISAKKAGDKKGKLGNYTVDKRLCLWFNDIHIQHKDIDGKFAFFGSSREPAGGVSRCGRFQRSDSRVGSVKRPRPE
jgi:hypothetical protein